VRTSTYASVGRRWSAVPLRLIVGYGFLAHGYAKVVNGPEHFAASLHALGVPAPDAMAWTTIGFEFVGGLAVLLGAWIPLFTVPLAAILLVAAISVHWQYGFSSIKLRAVTAAGPQFGPPGYETDLLYLGALATLVLGGAGPWCIDELIRRPNGRARIGQELSSASAERQRNYF
jgi:putative oxidoreductase